MATSILVLGRMQGSRSEKKVYMAHNFVINESTLILNIRESGEMVAERPLFASSDQSKSWRPQIIRSS